MSTFLGECPLKQNAPSFFQMVFGVVPVCGFGTFSTKSVFNSLSNWANIQIGGANYNGLVFDDVWPNVFLVLTETLEVTSWFYGNDPADFNEIHSLVSTGTRITTYTQTVDNFLTQTYETDGFAVNGPGLWGVNSDFGFQANQGVGGVSQGGTVYTARWQVPNGALPSSTYIYTATVSNRIGGSWSAWTKQASALLDTFDFPAWDNHTLQIPPEGFPVPGSCFGWMLFPTSTASFVQPPNNLSGNFSLLVMAAANGLAARIAGVSSDGTGGFLFSPDTPVLGAWEQDTPDPATLGYTAVLANCGAVVCIKSQWQLLGQPTAWPVMPSAPYNHLAGTWAQPMALGSPPTFEASYEPYIKLATNQIVQYTPADVIAALGSAPYGILGFRPPP